ncbi:hypothetical protein HEQ62_06925 [Haematospirillum jordaniae]|uniref:Transcriptional regulator HTH-type FeoC domain-containing protein n=1 Tax=Haematospirillum jordaniae TaxID=1549855 RepID=A0A143DAY0_9PROT|nr:FeoC-like transcriptional regulator [Haematospirillum jordaniae]AMW33864.1 hypothetical protein AY555_00300 [Haematospirillum jordaniae]NKD44494.1 hypothetical protein [Haematospirillum jordaniae]NKD57514.1 hypothetical protein [Haematospirillum jordaniae]NKD59508.1 hypothetical protein [Haematospirillum jordaniae]NKD67503.1 hypothetical protein [Haematospirillum jordaniae]
MNSLFAIRHCLQTYGPLSAADIAAHVNSTEEAVEPLIERWIAKGKARRITAPPPCGTRRGGCTTCPSVSVDLYEWV